MGPLSKRLMFFRIGLLLPLVAALGCTPDNGSWELAEPMSVDRAGRPATALADGISLPAAGPSFVGPSSSIYDPTKPVQDWIPVEEMSIFRYDHAVTLLPSGGALVTGGSPDASAELYDSATDSWMVTGSMATTRLAHTETLLPNGKLLVAGGYTYFPVTSLASAELYDPATLSFMATGPMTIDRFRHADALLPSGKVLITGGYSYSAGIRLGSVEIYDQDMKSFMQVGTMTTGRKDHSATLLPDDTILLFGGSDNAAPLASAELYDPGTNSSQETTGDPMTVAGYGHTATLLSNGQVLIAGGYNSLNAAQKNAEIFDPTNGTFTLIGPMNHPRGYHTAKVLPDGTVLIAGGGNQKSAEIFDPATGSFTLVDAMATPRTSHIMTLLPNGTALVAGGFNNIDLASAEIYAPAARWTKAAPLVEARAHHTTTVLLDGRVLIAGGEGVAGRLATVVLYNPATDTFTQAAPMNAARANHAATLLSTGRVLVTGGFGVNNITIKSTELYDPVADTWTLKKPMTDERSKHTATWLPGPQKVLVAGGFWMSGELGLRWVDIYDPTNDTWAFGADMTLERYDHTATLMNDGRVLVTGGTPQPGQFLVEAVIYDYSTDKWSKAGTIGSGRAEHTATLLANGKVLVAGGVSNNGSLKGASIFDPMTTTWTPLSPMLHDRGAHAAGLLPDGRVLVAGGIGDTGLEASAEVYDFTKQKWEEVRSLRLPHASSGGVMVANGSMFIAGGIGSNGLPLIYTERFSLLDQGKLCEQSADCKTGFCVDSVCCDTACDAGPCDVCSARTDITPLGTDQPGTCKPLTGPACNDGTACTQTDTCQMGVCIGTDPIICPESDQCHQKSACNPASGTCPIPSSQPDNFGCNDDNECTQVDTCQDGKCTGDNPILCALPDQCHNQGTCDPLTGECSEPEKDDGALCDDGNLCSLMDRCEQGKCIAGDPISCPALDQCHSEGTCDPTTGACNNPAKGEGAKCDADQDACTVGDSCISDVCTAGAPIICPLPDQCHKQSTCDPLTGECPKPIEKDDGANCNDDNPCTENDGCKAGECTPGTAKDCGAYACEKETGDCRDSCESIEDCAEGKVCDPNLKCIDPPPKTSRIDDTTCAAQRPGSGSGSFGAALLSVLGLALVVARRRASCSLQ